MALARAAKVERTMKNLSSLDLDKVTGGVFSPCTMSDGLTLGALKKMNKTQAVGTMALQMAQCGLPWVSKAAVNAKKHILFAT